MRSPEGTLAWVAGTACIVIALEACAAIPPARVAIGESSGVKIRVRITPVAATVPVHGFDLRILEQARVDGRDWRARLAASPSRQSEWELRCSRGRVRATRMDGVPGKAPELRDLIAPVAIETPAGFMSYGGHPYRGELVVYPSKSGCEVINELDLEKYLDGLVNSEFSAKWGEQGISAQVIAARTYAYYQMQEARHAGKHFDVDSTERDQVYDGSLKEDFRSSRAVEKTRGVILAVNEHGSYQPLKAFYHSTCGGTTELPERVWGTHYPGFKKVKCPFCTTSPRFSWALDLSSREIASRITAGAAREAGALGWPSDWKRLLARADLAELDTDEPAEGGRSSRVMMLWKDGTRSAELIAPASRMRLWLGAAEFRSTSFHASPMLKGQARLWHFEGRGNGHGVGLCQWGAKVMSEQGYTASAILKQYYPEAVLRKLW
jgi:stage II sporulation protein D